MHQNIILLQDAVYGGTETNQEKLSGKRFIGHKGIGHFRVCPCTVFCLCTVHYVCPIPACCEGT